MAYITQYTLQELRERLTVARRHLGAANKVLTNCIAIEKMADKELVSAGIHPIGDVIDPQLTGMSELLTAVSASVANPDYIAYAYEIRPGRPLDYVWATWTIATSLIRFTARNAADEALAAFGDVYIGANPDYVYAYWINELGGKSYIQAWDETGPSWGDASTLVSAGASAGDSLLVMNVDDWTPNEDLIEATSATFTVTTDWLTLSGNWSLNAGVAELALGTSGDFSWKQNTTTTPTLRHGHVYEVSYHIDGGTVMADEDSWFQFHIGETLGRKHYGGAGAEETGTVLTELIQAEQPPEAGTLTFEVYGDMQDAADILRFASIQISEVVPDPMELHVELSKRDFV